MCHDASRVRITALDGAFAALVAACLGTSAPAFAQAIELRSPTIQLASNFGLSVAAIRDIDKDGLDDVLVGAPSDSFGDPNFHGGLVYVFSGRTGALLRHLETPEAGPSLDFGRSVSSVRDVNGDGFDDIVVGAPLEPDGGRVYVFSGANGALLRTLISPNSVSPNSFGDTVAGLDDIDGDGRGDILVGAVYEDVYRGRAYVFSGATGALLHSFVSQTPSTHRSYFARAVAQIPDIDADGVPDIAIGAPQESYSDSPLLVGHVDLFSGATGEFLRMLVSPNTLHSETFGWGLAGVRDAGGPGVNGVLVGAESADTGSPPMETGTAYLFRGADGALLRQLNPPSSRSFDFGHSVAGVPDVDGDGYADALIGAWNEHPPGSFPAVGAAYLISGRTGALLRSFRSPGNRVYTNFGVAVAACTDASGDGRPDFIIGANGDCPGCTPGSPRGRAYIFFSCRADWDMSTTVDSADFFAFLADFFNDAADFNADWVTNSQDLFDFLTDFFTGC